MMKKIENFIQENSFSALLLIFIVGLIAKIVLVLPFEGPILFFDELLYEKNMFALSHLSYNTLAYPPLYSVSLLPATIFGDDFYFIMKLINILISSAIIIPIWLLVKEFSDKRIGVMVCFIATFMPFQFTFSKMIMSENLFYPLFLMSIYTFYKLINKGGTKWAVFSSLFLVSCILTRYFAFIMIPVYGIIYVYNLIIIWHSLTNEDKRNKAKELILFSSIFLFFLFSYIIPNLSYLRERTNEYFIDQLTVNPILNYFVWLIIYLSYSYLLISPFAYNIYKGIVHCIKNKKQEKNKFVYLVLISCLSVFFILFATKHSSLWDYHSRYLNGRYIMYIGLPWVIFSFSGLKVELNKIHKIIAIICLFSIFIFSIVILKGFIFKTANWLILSHISPDGFIFLKSSILISVLIFLLIVTSAFYKKLYYVGLMIFYLITTYLTVDILNVYKQQIASIIKVVWQKNSDKVIYLDKNSLDENGIFVQYLDFYGISAVTKNIPRNLDECSECGYLVVKEKIRDISPIAICEKEKSYIYKTPIIFSDLGEDLLSQFEDKAVIITKVVEANSYYKRNIALINSGQEIFVLPQCSFLYNIVDSVNKEVNLYVQFGFNTNAKNWNVSDGMTFSVVYRDSLGSKILFNEIVYPKDEDHEQEVKLPDKRCSKFDLIFSTDACANWNGDWGGWKDIRLYYK